MLTWTRDFKYNRQLFQLDSTAKGNGSFVYNVFSTCVYIQKYTCQKSKCSGTVRLKGFSEDFGH